MCLVWDLGEDPKEQMDLLSEVPRCFRAAGFCHGSKSTMQQLQYICQVCNIETCACLNSNHIISPRMLGQVGKVSLQQPTLISRIRRNSVSTLGTCEDLSEVRGADERHRAESFSSDGARKRFAAASNGRLSGLQEESFAPER